MLNRLLDGFEGKLTSSKYAIIEKTSPDTALRDITDLVDRPGTGRKQHGRESDAFTRLEQERDFERQERMERAASKTASAETARRG